MDEKRRIKRTIFTKAKWMYIKLVKEVNKLSKENKKAFIRHTVDLNKLLVKYDRGSVEDLDRNIKLINVYDRKDLDMMDNLMVLYKAPIKKKS
jgi:hypothetical protein